MAEANYVERLNAVKATVAALTGKRDQLNREAGMEERRVQEAYDRMKSLGLVADASVRLTPEELTAIRQSAQASLDATLAAIEEKVAEGKKLLAEYESVAA